jgi:hypothetical protein
MGTLDDVAANHPQNAVDVKVYGPTKARLEKQWDRFDANRDLRIRLTDTIMRAGLDLIEKEQAQAAVAE